MIELNKKNCAVVTCQQDQISIPSSGGGVWSSVLKYAFSDIQRQKGGGEGERGKGHSSDSSFTEAVQTLHINLYSVSPDVVLCG